MKRYQAARQSKRQLFEKLIAGLCLVAIICFSIAPTLAQDPSPSPSHLSVSRAVSPNQQGRTSSGAAGSTNPWTVMCVAAHPDDEDGTTLTILRRKNGVHTVSLFSTYGEGGQNAVGPELYEELGVIRAHETLKASEIQGSEPYFLGLERFRLFEIHGRGVSSLGARRSAASHGPETSRAAA